MARCSVSDAEARPGPRQCVRVRHPATGRQNQRPGHRREAGATIVTGAPAAQQLTPVVYLPRVLEAEQATVERPAVVAAAPSAGRGSELG